jgi:hypothetical protein
MDAHHSFQCQPKAEQWILSLLSQAEQNNSFIAELQYALLKKTSTRLFDWIDHLSIGYTNETLRELKSCGFVPLEEKEAFHVYHHPGAQFPKVVVYKQTNSVIQVALSVDSIAEFLMVQGGAPAEIEGTPYSGYRRCCVSQNSQATLWVIERRGTQTMEPMHEEPAILATHLQALEKWEKRQRAMEDEDLAMKETLSLAQELIDQVGTHRAAWIVLEGERRYWQARNHAGQLQKMRQDHLGMGWANHDHHTFRSSRRRFADLVRLFELLGFHCRERFYAGKEAGWGAQIMENPICRLVLFLDVDLSPEEIEEDFAHQPLKELSQLGTIGLWCALHGDSILKAGMHHLEAQFLFDELSQDLDELGIKMMKPFSFFPYLKQAFTVGEVWPVDPKRVQKLVDAGKLSPEHAHQFLTQGAIGSHLENLQRREGYKGFNQKNVSAIIKRTDPRYEMNKEVVD